MAQAQKIVKVSATKRISKFSVDLKKDPNEVQFETNMVLIKNSVRSETEEESVATIQDLQRIIQELRDQRNLDSLSMQEMQSRLEELGEIGAVKKTSRGVTKKSFTPVDANQVENPIKTLAEAQAEAPLIKEEDSPLSKKEMFKAKVKELTADKETTNDKIV